MYDASINIQCLVCFTNYRINFGTNATVTGTVGEDPKRRSGAATELTKGTFPVRILGVLTRMKVWVKRLEEYTAMREFNGGAVRPNEK